MSACTQKGTGSALSTRGLLPSLVTGQEWVLFVLIAALWAVLGVTTPAFLTQGSIVPLLVSVAPIALIGVGMTFVMITGGIDVSVGGMVMLTAVVAAKLLVNETPAGLAIIIVTALGAVLGLLNGIIVALGKIHPIIVTFGTANLFQFAAFRIFDSSTVSGIPPALDVFGRGVNGRTLGIPHSFIVTCVVVGLAWIFLRHFRAGRHLYAVGGNQTAAVRAGVQVTGLAIMSYVLTGLLAGFAANFVIASGTSTVEQSIGIGTELLVIAAVVIGGTSVLGGRGSVLGTLLGAVLVQTVRSGVTQLGWPSQSADLFVGIAIVLAVGVDIIRERRSRRES